MNYGFQNQSKTIPKTFEKHLKNGTEMDQKIIWIKYKS